MSKKLKLVKYIYGSITGQEYFYITKAQYDNCNINLSLDKNIEYLCEKDHREKYPYIQEPRNIEFIRVEQYEL